MENTTNNQDDKKAEIMALFKKICKREVKSSTLHFESLMQENEKLIDMIFELPANFREASVLHFILEHFKHKSKKVTASCLIDEIKTAMDFRQSKEEFLN